MTDEEKILLLREMLISCWYDLGHWIEVANHQREVLPHNHAACPTETGIEHTAIICEQISGVLRASETESGE